MDHRKWVQDSNKKPAAIESGRQMSSSRNSQFKNHCLGHSRSRDERTNHKANAPPTKHLNQTSYFTMRKWRNHPGKKYIKTFKPYYGLIFHSNEASSKGSLVSDRRRTLHSYGH